MLSYVIVRGWELELELGVGGGVYVSHRYNC